MIMKKKNGNHKKNFNCFSYPGCHMLLHLSLPRKPSQRKISKTLCPDSLKTTLNGRLFNP